MTGRRTSALFRGVAGTVPALEKETLMPPRAKSATVAAARDDARAAALAKFIASSAKTNGAGSVFSFVGKALSVDVISTGALSLDDALGVGGLPRGRITEIYGPESAGKTSLALSVAAQAIQGGGMAALIDVEHAIGKEHVRGMGVDPDYLAISQPNSAENAFAMLEEMLRADMFDVIIVDSVAMLTPQAELDGEMTDQQVGLQARVIGKGLRKVNALVGASKSVVIFINQLRVKVGVLYGNPEDTPGGKALKYVASVRLDVRAAAGDRIKDPNDAKRFIGLGTKVTVKKNKVAPPQGVAEYNLIWGKGIDFASSVVAVAKNRGVLVADGGHRYTIAATGEIISDEAGVALRGEAKVAARLKDFPDLLNEISALCYAAIRDRGENAGSDGPIPDSDFEDEMPAEMDEAPDAA